MSEDSTTGRVLSPLDSARDAITNARQLSGSSPEPLTMTEREQIVKDLSYALRELDRVEREYELRRKEAEA